MCLVERNFTKAASCGPTAAILVYSFRQCNCIYFLYAIEGEGINIRSRSQVSFKIGIVKNFGKFKEREL